MSLLLIPSANDFIRVYSILTPKLRVRTVLLFLFLAGQSFFELAFLLMLTLMGMALTDADSVRGNIVFKTLFFIFPFIKESCESPRSLVLVSGGVVVLFSILKNTISFLSAKKTASLSEDISIEIGKEIMSRFLFRDYGWHLSSESSTTFQRMMWRNHISSLLVSLLSMYACIITLCLLFFSLVSQEPILTTLVVAVIGVIGFILYRMIRFNVDKNAHNAAISSQEETRALMCATRGIRDVLIYRQQDVFQAAITDAAIRGKNSRIFNILSPTLPTWILETAGFILVVIAIGYLIYFENADTTRITAALALLMLTAWRVLPYANRIVGYQVNIRALRPMTDAVLTLLENLRHSPSDPSPSPARDFSFSKSITFDHVYFKYAEADSDSLIDLNFSIIHGEKIGVIGPSGAGKSTLVGVLSGLLPPTKGHILVDDKTLTPERGAALAAMIGYVPQSPFLFSGTLAENVAFSEWGQPINEEKVIVACKKAAIDFYEDHPKGIYLPIGENGSGLSGGQAQRVSIARALYNNPKIIIFDEATSALDQENEKNIQSTIDNLAGDVTCVIIAHRHSTIASCDRLILVKDGNIISIGITKSVLEEYNKIT